MAENSSTSPKLKEVISYTSNPLTEQELESLKKEMQDSFDRLDQLTEEAFQKEEAERVSREKNLCKAE